MALNVENGYKGGAVQQTQNSSKQAATEGEKRKASIKIHNIIQVKTCATLQLHLVSIQSPAIILISFVIPALSIGNWMMERAVIAEPIQLRKSMTDGFRKANLIILYEADEKNRVERAKTTIKNKYSGNKLENLNKVLQSK